MGFSMTWIFILGLLCFPAEVADAAVYSSSFDELEMETEASRGPFGSTDFPQRGSGGTAAFWLPGRRAFHPTRQMKICGLPLLPWIWGGGLHLLNGASIPFDYLEFLARIFQDG
ncbi:hypothetical protein KSP40_PGU005146 [Platanthera guangdongensis]|uniref:Uncharacterized protein n=1 Tax=Platanthera guangdongensis TaxID=2320717 RepID=A0ABR2N474_9ASPA